MNCHRPTALAWLTARGFKPDSMMERYFKSSGRLYFFKYFSYKESTSSVCATWPFVYSRSRTVKYWIKAKTVLLYFEWKVCFECKLTDLAINSGVSSPGMYSYSGATIKLFVEESFGNAMASLGSAFIVSADFLVPTLTLLPTKKLFL